ncbi:hypothetical protein EJ08DRAFT_719060 [Tothia fuscella]|uniref:Uncharacterized protein n=1 Tax=Tothia fuscella TaxID=1048955 RepID=A0A9P4TWU7_9PEZI|nr:hypothetical protein EJ08DRAFT_719060 [Tothia fuscella]
MSEYDDDRELYYLGNEPDYAASVLASGFRAAPELDFAVGDLDDFNFEPFVTAAPRGQTSRTASLLQSSGLLQVDEFQRLVELKRDESSESGTYSPVGLRSLEYVTTPNENLICAICTSPFIKPVELNCQHIFCEECLYDHLKSGIQSASLCPKCRDPIESLCPTSRLLTQLLDELEVVCPNEPCGCKTLHKRYTIHDHVSSYCDFENVPCPAADCERFIPRRLLNGECLHSQLECDECEDLMMEMELEVRVLPTISYSISLTRQQDHIKNKCPSGLLCCKHCALNLRRGDLAEHHARDCEKIPISCRGRIIGCPITGPRQFVNEHMKTCPIALMAPHIQEQNERQSKLQAETSQIRSQLIDLETKFDELEASFKQLSTSIKRERRQSLATGGTVSASRVEELTGRLDELALDHNSRIDNATSENARMHMNFVNESLRNQQQFHTFNATLTVMRNQLNMLSSLRATGNNANNTTNAANAVNAANSGSSGIGLDSVRREPPKL